MISVIIPNYNHAPFLKERIDSVLNQTYQDFEVIILDDKSSDNSRDIIDQYRNHPKISHIVYNKVNSGSTFKQWQKGMNLAKGEYIWIAESDDVANPEFLRKLMNGIVKDKDIVLGFSSLDIIDANGEIITRKPLATYQKKNVEIGTRFLKRNFIFGCHILNASSVIFKKETLNSVPLDFMSFKGAGDYLFWIEVARQGKVYKESESLDYFRLHNNKVTPTAVSSGLQFKETNRIFHRLCDLNIINNRNRNMAVGFWLYRILKSKTLFSSKDIFHEVWSLWNKETKYPNLSIALYLMNGICRRISKKYLSYSK